MNNTVIEVIDEEHGKKVLEFWRNLGVDTAEYKANQTLENCGQYRYYGVVFGRFSNFNKAFVESCKVNIITLPEEEVFPKVMYVSTRPFNKNNPGVRRVVFCKKCGLYIAWLNAETLEAAENESTLAAWRYARDIEKVPEEPVKMTMHEICKILGPIEIVE